MGLEREDTYKSIRKTKNKVLLKLEQVNEGLFHPLFTACILTLLTKWYLNHQTTF